MDAVRRKVARQTICGEVSMPKTISHSCGRVADRSRAGLCDDKFRDRWARAASCSPVNTGPHGGRRSLFQPQSRAFRFEFCPTTRRRDDPSFASRARIEHLPVRWLPPLGRSDNTVNFVGFRPWSTASPVASRWSSAPSPIGRRDGRRRFDGVADQSGDRRRMQKLTSLARQNKGG